MRSVGCSRISSGMSMSNSQSAMVDGAPEVCLRSRKKLSTSRMRASDRCSACCATEAT
jgi:hypothetical protein